MSTIRNKLADLDKEIESIAEKQAELSEQDYQLSEQRRHLIKEILIEENFLKETTWELFVSTNNSIFLKYISGSDIRMEELRNLCFHSWHDSISYQDGVSLHFDDGEYSLYAEDTKQLKSFIIKNNLMIVAKDVTDKVKRLSQQLISLQEIVHHFNLTS